MVGPRLSAFKILGPADKDEADVIWVYDMMKEMGVSQHNMCSCSVTAVGDILFVCTSNGVDESHLNIPSPDAPSFFAMDKNTGKVYWTDKSPGGNIHHGQWSSPTVATLGGVPQVFFGGGDGWLYSFKADKGVDGKPELLWKADLNPKDAVLILGGRGTRNDIIGTPVVYDGLVYVAVGQDPEHGEGIGHLYCIDPTKRGDVSEMLAVDRQTQKVIAHKRVLAVEPDKGEVAIANPNSAVVWRYSTYDANQDGKIDFEETMHRSCGTVAIKNDLLFIADFSGLIHCVDAKSGKVYWTYDMLAASWGSPLIVGDHVYIGDEDGDIVVFKLSSEKHDPVFEVNMLSSVYTTPVVANGVLYIANKDHLFAIEASK
jgi:outer membrane protein assembly factor BamB